MFPKYALSHDYTDNTDNTDKYIKSVYIHVCYMVKTCCSVKCSQIKKLIFLICSRNLDQPRGRFCEKK